MASVLAVDFGSSNTAAAYLDSGGRVHELRLSSTGALMSSAVLWSHGRILVGQAAMQAMLTNPDGFEPSPKRRLADREIFLGDALVPVTDLVAAVLAEVFARAERVMGGAPDRVVLTHPDKWSAGQQQQLADAAVQAGTPRERISLVSEATAAAQFYTATGRELPVGARVAVCDFGAGTVDVAVLDKQADGGFTVIAADGVEGLGGHDLDARIYSWVRQQLYSDEPVLAAELDDPTDVGGRLMLGDRIREAKEALSETAATAIAVRGSAGTRVVQLTRDEFDRLIGAEVDQAVELTRRVLADANRIRPSTSPPTIYLAGGSSAIPLIHNRLAELGAVATLGDPKTVVCQGALHAAAMPASSSTPAMPSLPTSSPEIPAAPSSRSSPPPSNVRVAQSQQRESPLTPTHAEVKAWWKRPVVVAPAALAIVAAVVIATSLSSSSREPDREARAGTPSSPRLSSTAVAEPPDISTLLLATGDVNSIMSPSVLEGENVTDRLRNTGDVTYSPAECKQVLSSETTDAYADSGLLAVRGQALRSADGQAVVGQHVIQYASSDIARAFVKTSLAAWEKCRGRPVTVTFSTGPLEMVPDVIAGTDDVTSAWTYRNQPTVCRHTVRAVSSFVVDVLACAPGLIDQEATIASRIADKIDRG